MSIANNIDYGGAFSHPCVAGAAPSELEVMLMSTVSAVPQGDESFEQQIEKTGTIVPDARLKEHKC